MALSPLLEPRLRHTVDTVRRVSRLPVVFAGVVRPGGLLLGTGAGMRTGALDGLFVAREEGLGGRTVQVGRPLAVPDYRTAPTISHAYDRQVGAEGLVSMVAVPVLSRGDVVAVLYGAARRPGRIGDRAVADLESAARRLGRPAVPAPDEPPPGIAPGIDGLVERIRRHAESVADPRLRDELLSGCEDLDRAGDPRRPVDRFTPHELDVLTLVASGCANETIAGLLDTTVDAVKGHLHKSMRKLGARSRHAAVSIARARGLLG